MASSGRDRNQDTATGRGTRGGSTGDAEDSFQGSRHPSPAVANPVGRDAADVDTTNGIPSAPANPKQHDQTDPTGQSHSDGAFVTEGSLKDEAKGPRPGG